MEQVHLETMDHDSYHILEDMFIDGYRAAKDKLVYLRLAHIPFQLPTIDHSVTDATLYLNAVKIENLYEVGCVSPTFGTDQVLHQMYPGEMVRAQHSLRFIYVGTDGIVEKSLQELLGLVIEDKDEHDLVADNLCQ